MFSTSVLYGNVTVLEVRWLSNVFLSLIRSESGRSMYNPNLPIPLTSLLGREQEIATLRQLLRRPGIRLITIIGPGGVGKTSLALRVAHAAQGSFADGVFYVSLAPISDPTLIAPTIAQTLSLPESPHRLWLDSLEQGTEWTLDQKQE